MTKSIPKEALKIKLEKTKLDIEFLDGDVDLKLLVISIKTTKSKDDLEKILEDLVINTGWTRSIRKRDVNILPFYVVDFVPEV